VIGAGLLAAGALGGSARAANAVTRTGPYPVADANLAAPLNAAAIYAASTPSVVDLIIAVDGTRVHGPSALVAAVATHRPGEKITLEVVAGSSTLTITATLTTQPGQAPAGS
jgi:S1-C subfamily serine protease